MNCKPGDIAIIVSARNATGRVGEISRSIVGRIVRVTRLCPPRSTLTCFASLVWEFEEPLRVVYEGVEYIATGCADSEMRPIPPLFEPEADTVPAEQDVSFN